MIHYLVTEKRWYTMDIFLSAEATLRDRVSVLPYERATTEETLGAGVYIFSDLERFSDTELRAAIALARRLRGLGPAVKLLNDPERVLRRYELQRMLHAQGVNRFKVFRIPNPLPSDPPTGLRFPVFLREQYEHNVFGDLLYSWRDVRKAVRNLVRSGKRSPEDFLIVEWCDTSDAAGVFRMYEAFVIGEKIVPRHLLCSRDWVVKDYSLVASQHLHESRTYVTENPHAGFLKDVARRAGIDYGRFDYALLDGHPQVWEINTNPLVITLPPGQLEIKVDVESLSFELHRIPMRRIATALMALDSGLEEPSLLPLKETEGIEAAI